MATIPFGTSGWAGGGYHFYVIGTSGSELMIIRVGTSTLVWNDSTTKAHLANAQGGAWQQWAIVRDDDDVIFYINGAAMGAAKTLSSSQGATTVNKIGSGWHGGATYLEWEGNIDEVALFDATLDADAMAAIYNSGTPTDLSSESNLVAYWRLEEGAGTSAADSSANSNTGTLQNGTAWDADVAAAG